MTSPRDAILIVALCGATLFVATRKPADVLPASVPAAQEQRAPPVAKKQSVPAQKQPSLVERKASAASPRDRVVPRTKAPPSIIKKEKRERAVVKKQRAAGSQQRRPTTNECAQMANGVAVLGRAGVKAGGRLRGYSEAQVERALRDCGL